MDCLYCGALIEGAAAYGLHENCYLGWFDLPRLAEFKDLDPKKSSIAPVTTAIRKKKDTFFHGRYLKYSARLGPTEYILKVQEDEFPELPMMEFTCNRIASLLAIDVPQYFLINFNGRITFVTRNFMQDYVGTLNHIYKFLPDGEENHNCAQIVRVILEQTGRLADVARFVEICLFDSLVGNNDRHGRNLGIIETHKLKRLAPMYDNPSFFGVENDFLLEADFNPSGSIWTANSSEPKVVDYITEFRTMGLERVVTQFRKRLLSKFPLIAEEVNLSKISKKRRKAFLRFLEKRLGDFENA